jgi:2-succinyl-5-enolpyruvyl-6-hydroxy-3-cyclohexene-1-carboxylate synthase
MGSGRLTGGVIAAALNDVDWGALVVASSLPVREVDAHLDRPGPVFANRGASGIDGFVSMSVGVASVAPGTLALAGDISFLHDSNGLLLADPVNLAMIVVDNGGGGLFDSLPQREHAPEFERLFITNPNRDLAGLARFHGARVAEVDDVEELRMAASEALARDGLDVILARVDRQVDLAQRRQLG